MFYAPFCLEPGYDKNKPLIIYGYGMLCLANLPLFLNLGIKVIAIFDANPQHHNSKICGIPILPPARMKEFDREVNVFISTIQGKFTFTKFFKDLGFCNIFYSFKEEFDYMNKLISQREESCKTIADHQDEIKYARSFFKDAHSLEIFDARLNAYANSEFTALEKCYSTPDYFRKDIFNFTANEIFADVGVFDGDNCFEFRDALEGKYDYVYAFDGNELLAAVVARRFAYHHFKNAEVHHYAICDKAGTVSFNNCGALGNIAETGGEEVNCTSLDIFFAKPGRKTPTFIKMDIEGAEIDALAGAKNTIAAHMPKLAICAYHKLEHLWEVPISIYEKQSGKGYSYYLRHQGSIWETVCFAAPKS